MDINQPSPKLNQKSQKRSIRPTLGLLVHNLSFDLRRGVEEVARQKKANLKCFPGGIVHDPLGFNSQANILYNLIDPKRFDSLIIWLSVINGYMNPEGVQEFIGQYEPIPRIAQVNNTLIAIHRLPKDDWMGYTHAHFPAASL